MARLLKLFAMLGLAALLSACEGGTEPVSQVDPTLADITRDRKTSTFGDLLAFNREDAAGGGGNLLVNRYLWRASLDTLSFMPLDSTDPFSGVIATDWATSEANPDERFKVTVYITSPRLEARALNVAVFREVRDGTGGWRTAPVSETTPRRLEDSILTRARQIKVAELEEARKQG